jgi:hypothetical protein
MTLDFQWNEDDFAESERLVLRGIPRDKRGVGVFGLFILGLLIGDVLWRRFAHIPALYWRLLTGCLFAVVLVFIARFLERWLTRWWFRRLYRKLPRGVQLPRQIVTNEHEMVYTTAMYQRRASWTSIVKWRETNTSFLIYIKFSLFVLIPKRGMLPGQVSALRELLSLKVHSSQRDSSMFSRLFPRT